MKLATTFTGDIGTIVVLIMAKKLGSVAFLPVVISVGKIRFIRIVHFLETTVLLLTLQQFALDITLNTHFLPQQLDKGP